MQKLYGMLRNFWILRLMLHESGQCKLNLNHKLFKSSYHKNQMLKSLWGRQPSFPHSCPSENCHVPFFAHDWQLTILKGTCSILINRRLISTSKMKRTKEEYIISFWQNCRFMTLIEMNSLLFGSNLFFISSSTERGANASP